MRSSPLRLLGKEEQPLHELPVRQPQAGFTKSAANILETLLGSFDKKPPRLFARIDSVGVQNAVDITTRLSELPEEGKRILFRTVFGATEKMPLAALAYLLPSIRLAEELQNIQVNRSAMPVAAVGVPKIEFLQMNDAGIRINGLDHKKVFQQGDEFVHVATAYIERFHPRVASSVSFLDDKTLTPELLQNPIFKLSKLVVTFVAGAHRRTLRGMTKRHAKSEGFSRYAALHSFVHDVVNTTSHVSALASFGADSETVFYGIRRKLRPILRLDKQRRTLPTIQYITSHSTPPYHMMAGGDIALSDVLKNSAVILEENPDVHSPVRKALDQLQSDAGGKRELFDFFKSHERR